MIIAWTVPAKRVPNYMFFLLVVIGVCAFLVYLVLNGRSFLPVSARDETINLLASGWKYLPGVSPQSDGLRVSYLGRAIVQQNGSTGQANPAVNVYGTHLQSQGDFSLRATLKNIQGGAVVHLYDSVPIIQDEFRVEPASLELKFTGNTVTVSTWNDYANQKLSQQLPVETHRYTITPLDNAEVSIKRQSDKLVISINGSQLAELPESSLFKKQVWFGLSAENPGDSWLLSRLVVDAASGVTAINAESVATYGKSSDALQVVASGKRSGFLVGAAVALNPAVADEKYAQVLLGGNFGQITTENTLKWQFIHPQPTVYDFREADALVDIARKNHLTVHGHTLVFGEANPTWVQALPTTTVANKEHVKQIMTDHISRTVGHFKGKIASWDVVNEPLADYDTVVGVDGLRKHIWYEALGETYIATAFTAAHQADPQAKLYINEFGLESDDDRWQTFLALMTKLKSQGVPIDGVGFQAHVYEHGDAIDPAVLRDHIRALAKLGLASRISEMDVYDGDGVVAQARQYADIFNACFAESSCVSWSTWGLTDRYDLSLDETGRLQYGHDFLWDEHAQPTPAVAAIRGMLQR